MHSRYSPATDSTTHSQIWGGLFLPSSSPATGTSTTYIAVMKLALAVEGSRVMPICWAADAAKSRVPQTAPPRSKSRRSPGADGTRGRALASTRHSPHKKATASQLRQARKAKGAKDAPALWATKARPQIRAQSTSRRVLRVCTLIPRCPPP